MILKYHPIRHGPDFHQPQSQNIARLTLSDQKSGLSPTPGVLVLHYKNLYGTVTKPYTLQRKQTCLRLLSVGNLYSLGARGDLIHTSEMVHHRYWPVTAWHRIFLPLELP